jgi:ribosomal protein S18 acetylase RimI-like enzyme
VTPGISLEILDLRHFAAALLKPLLDAEGTVWNNRLHWDYRASARLLMQYLDSRMLPGYAAVDGGRVVGYGFCVYEESKAVIGDVYAHPELAPSADETPQTAQEIEDTLLEHLLATLQHSPQVDRIESQLLLHPSGKHGRIFRENGFELYRRLFMVQQLERFRVSGRAWPVGEVELRTWRDDDLTAAGRLISEAYQAHPDSLINDQYRSQHGSMRFLHNIVRYSGCGTFSPAVSHVAIDRDTREMVGLVLGSRVSTHSGHITQLCVTPGHRRQGLGRLMLETAASIFHRQGMTEVSLTVTEANARAIELYESEGYTCRHTFDAAVWQRGM